MRATLAEQQRGKDPGVSGKLGHVHLKGPARHDLGLLMVPPSALSSSALLSPASGTVNVLLTWGTSDMKHLPPCKSLCPRCTPGLGRLSPPTTSSWPFLKECHWAAEAGFPFLEKSQNARNFPTPHCRSAQPLIDTCRKSHSKSNLLASGQEA